MSKPARPSCYQKALELLARRPHFRRELADKLSSRGYPEEEIEDALQRAEDLGYLDDLQCARDYVSARLGRGGIGRRRLEAELLRRGVPKEIIGEALADLSPDQDLKAAQAAAERWWRQRRGDMESLARHLDRKGFSQRAILLILEQYRDRGGSDCAK